MTDFLETFTPLETAIDLAVRFGWHVFPQAWRGRPLPLIDDQHSRATTDIARIEEWWRRWPKALIGVSAGVKSGVICLDIDVKHPPANGWHTLELMGRLPLPETPMEHSRSGGLHLFFRPGDVAITSSIGRLGAPPGKGPDGKPWNSGLDVLGDGYSFTTGPGYTPDPILNLDTVPLAPAPAWLNLPPKPAPARPAKPIRPCVGLSPYGDAAIQRACVAIRQAPDGSQHVTLRDESFAIGTLAGAGGIPADFARAALIDAGCGMVSYDRRNQWTPKSVERVVDDSFRAGLARPRPTTGGRASR